MPWSTEDSMVSLTLNKHQLLRDLGVEESPELLHQIAMMGVEVDSSTANELVVDITPNRPDLLSQQGFTRALAAFLNIRPGLRTYTTTQSKLKVFVDESVKGIRPFTACAVVRNLKLDEEKLKEIINVQEKLHVTFCRRRKRGAIGIYPMENISGNITYLAMEPSKIKFRPLEAEKEMTAQEILEHHPKGKEYAHLLKGLPRYAVFMDSKKKILSVPPIINSHDTGKITIHTAEAFLECSGSDLRTCQEVIQIICATLADMGATIQTVEVIYGRRTEVTPDMASKRQEFYGYYVNRRLGLHLKKEDLAPLLARMGLGFEEGRIKETYYAIIPPYRVDFLHQIDVVEDLAIAYGYENIHAELPKVVTIASRTPSAKFEDVLRKVLVGFGLLEAKNYHLIKKDFQVHLDGNAEVATLKSSVSEEYDSLRKSLLACMLQTFMRNRLHEYPQGFFEIGTVFAPSPMAVQEHKHLCIAMAGEVDYTRIRQIVDGVLLALGLEGTFASVEDPRFLKGRAARLGINDISIGVLGEVAPRVLENSQLTVPVAAAELDVDALRRIVLK
jgi:phenylalanyl-tRNA synthetase beta chain